MEQTSYSEKISSVVSLLILFLIAFGLTETAFSQTSAGIYSSTVIVSSSSHQDGMLMHEGKVWQVESGKATLVEREVTIHGGTRVKPDGTVVTKSGYNATLNEGDFINSSGKLIAAKQDAIATNDKDEEDSDEN